MNKCSSSRPIQEANFYRAPPNGHRMSLSRTSARGDLFLRLAHKHAVVFYLVPSSQHTLNMNFFAFEYLLRSAAVEIYPI